MPLVLLILIRNQRFASLVLLLFVGAIGMVEFNELFYFESSVSFLYGLRDVFLIVLVAELASGNIKTDNIDFNLSFFLYTVMFLALCDAVISNILELDFYRGAYNLESYYANKKVEIQLGFGILGDRIGLPLYSPSLLGTMLPMYYFFDKRIALPAGERTVALIVSVFTATKVVPLMIIYYLVGRRWLIATLLGIPLLLVVFAVLYEFAGDDPFLSTHFSSVLGHLQSFTTALEANVFSFRPDLLGSNSTAIVNLASSGGVETGLMESLILARLADLKAWSILLAIYIVYFNFSIKSEFGRKIFFIFVLVSVLTATSNHPIAWVPALVLIYQKHPPRVSTARSRLLSRLFGLGTRFSTLVTKYRWPSQ